MVEDYKNKKQIHVVCKSNNQDRLNLVFQYWGSIFNKTNVQELPKSLIIESVVTADKETLQEGECRWFYCPAYHFCPFSSEVAPGVNGRASKKKLDVKFDGLSESDKSGNNSNFGISDKVTDIVIRGDESL